MSSRMGWCRFFKLAYVTIVPSPVLYMLLSQRAAAAATATATFLSQLKWVFESTSCLASRYKEDFLPQIFSFLKITNLTLNRLISWERRRHQQQQQQLQRHYSLVCEAAWGGTPAPASASTISPWQPQNWGSDTRAFRLKKGEATTVLNGGRVQPNSVVPVPWC